jgi:hypothetical protein
MANRRFIDFPVATTVGANDIILIWQDGLNKQTTKATILSGLPEDLEDLADVNISGLTNGQILRYDSTTGKWENTDQGNLDLNDLNDVSIVSPSNGQVLVYNSSTSKWENSSGGFVPYVGAVTTVDLGAQGLRAGYVRFNTSVVSVPDEQGLMYWDADDETVAVILNGTIMKIGEDQFYPVKNQTGNTIAKGTAVRFAGTVGASGRLLIAPFIADNSVPSSRFMGVTSEAILNGADGKVMWFGRIRGINTNAFNEGDILYASTTTAGGFQTAIPLAPNNIVQVAAVVTKSTNNGTIFVRPTLGSNINKDEGVKIVSPTTGQLLQLQANGLWENKTKAQVLGGTSSQFVKGDGSLDSNVYALNSALANYQLTSEKAQPNGYASLDSNGKVPLVQINDALIGNVNFQGLWNAATNTPTLANPPALGTKGYYYIVSTAGTFASISFEVGDWIISNGTAWGKVDNTDAVSSVFGRTGNVTATNGDYNTSQVTENTNLYYTEARVNANTNVAANTAARHNAVTLGTANGLSLSTQVLSLGLASAGVTGALSGTDWSTFNSKQPAGNYVTTDTAQTITGVKTFSQDIIVNSVEIGRGSGNVSSNTSVGVNSLEANTTGSFNTSIGSETLNKNTTGFNNTAVGRVALGDNTTGNNNTAFGNLALYLNTTGSQNTGIGYSALGGITTGINNVAVGHIAGNLINSGADNITSSNSVYLGHDTRASASGNSNEIVIGHEGRGNGSNTVTIGNSSITNNYFTGNIRGGAFIKSGGTSAQFLKADGSVDSTSYGTGSVTSVAALTLGTTGTDLSSSVANGTTTPVITLNVPTASAANRGALSAADWTTFNNKQNALTNPVTGTGTAGQVAFWSSGSAITGESNLFWDATNDRLGIGTASPTLGRLQSTTDGTLAQLVLQSTDASGVAWRFTELAGTLTINPVSGISRTIKFTNSGAGSLTTIIEKGNVLIGTTNDSGIKLNVFRGSVGTAAQFRGASTDILNIDLDNDAVVFDSRNVSYTAFENQGNERMRITSAGNVGIGTASPSTLLHVNGFDAAITISGTRGTGATHSISTSGVNNDALALSGQSLLVFRTASTERMRITASGRVLIGTPPPTESTFQLDVNGTARVSGAATFSSSVTTGGGIQTNISKSGSGIENVNFLQLRLFGTNAIGDSLDIRYLNSAGNNIANISAILGGDNVAYGSLAFSTRNFFTDSMVEVMRINNRGNVGIGITAPTTRLDIGNGTLTLPTLRGRTYTLSNVSSANPNFINGTGFNSIPVRVGDIIDLPFSQTRTVTAVTDTQLTVDSAWTTSFAGVNVEGRGAIVFQTNNLDRLTIAGTGNVGIGTSAFATSDFFSSVPLQVNSISGNIALRLHRPDATSGAGVGGLSFAGNDSSGNQRDIALIQGETSATNSNGGALRFLTRADAGSLAERMRITSGGNVLIGTTSDNGSRLQVAGSVATPHTTKSSNYTLDATDYTVGFDCASNRTATLPDATTCAGRIYVIYQYNTGSGTRSVTLDGNGSQTINGVTTYSLAPYCDFTSVVIQSNGSNWIIISSNLTVDCL